MWAGLDQRQVGKPDRRPNPWAVRVKIRDRQTSRETRDNIGTQETDKLTAELMRQLATP